MAGHFLTTPKLPIALPQILNGGRHTRKMVSGAGHDFCSFWRRYQVRRDRPSASQGLSPCTLGRPRRRIATASAVANRGESCAVRPAPSLLATLSAGVTGVLLGPLASKPDGFALVAFATGFNPILLSLMVSDTNCKRLTSFNSIGTQRCDLPTMARFAPHIRQRSITWPFPN